MAKYKIISTGEEYEVKRPYKNPIDLLDNLLQQFHKPIVGSWNKVFLARQLETVYNLTTNEAYDIIETYERRFPNGSKEKFFEKGSKSLPKGK